MSKNPFLACLHVQAVSTKDRTTLEAGGQRLAQRWCKGSICSGERCGDPFESDECDQNRKSLKIAANEKDVPTNKTFLLIKLT